MPDTMVNTGLNMQDEAHGSASRGKQNISNECCASNMSGGNAKEDEEASIYSEADKVRLDVQMASTESESHYNDLLPRTQIVPPDSASSVDGNGHDLSMQLTGSVSHNNQQSDNGEAQPLAKVISPDVHSEELAINQGVTEVVGQVKTPVSLYAADLPDAQQNASCLDLGTMLTIALPSVLNAVLPDTQCGNAILEEAREGSDRAVNAEKAESLPSKMPSFITGHFKASKSSMLNETSLSARTSQDFNPLAKRQSDDEPPDTQPSLPTSPQRPEETLKYQPSLPATSTNQASYAATQEPSFSQASVLAYERLSEAQRQKQTNFSPLKDGDTVYFENSQSSIITSGDVRSPLNRVSCKERKRITVSSNRPPRVTKAMVDWVSHMNWLLDPFREDDDCWLHPSPPSARLSVSGIFRPVGKLQKRFAWKDNDEKHSVVLNYGIVVKLVNFQMTKQQQDGFINKQWHLSHLCGNWTCLNPYHTTVEPGAVNVSRNSCFSHRSGCLHTPKCLKEKKVALGADGKLVDHSEQAAESIAEILQVNDSDYSSPLLLDDEDTIMDDFEASDSELQDDMDSSNFASEMPSGEDKKEVLNHQVVDAKHILPI
ncbi:hypothetical protein VTL71DRAFT_3509 [Oculimacula yallundae]|uniref:Zinc-binding loop region of homing endonuclease domain-containing protein n=1 Tax=Oculimacula yallundae TaxID=86028 RepID=A0ABR4C9A1_9HELO